MAYLDSTDWRYDPVLRDELFEQTWGSFYLVEVFDRAMELLHRHLRDGSIYRESKRILDEYPPVELTQPMNGYAATDLTKLFSEGDFRYGNMKDELTIRSMEPGFCEYAIGAAYLDDEDVYINWRYFHAMAAKDSSTFSDDGIGRQRLAWEVAGVVLHEVMHNHGFDHPDYQNVLSGDAAMLPNLTKARESAFDPRFEYFRTLPCVAEQAVYLIAKDDFAGTNHDPSRERRWPTPCCCHVRSRPKSDGPFGGMTLELPMSDEREESVRVRSHQDGR